MAKGPVHRSSSTVTQWTAHRVAFLHVSPHFTLHEPLCASRGCPAVTSGARARGHTHVGSLRRASDLLLTPSSALGSRGLGCACRRVSQPCAEGSVCGQMYQK